ncbi:hypothetical protein LTR86_000345 [Recurvomyces mirabilis]|nr:hypothetical protein LTR86_000345 [Recurvomyces mirabilis]
MDAIELNAQNGVPARPSSSLEDHNGSTSEVNSGRAQNALPPTDQGYRAWLCLAGCFVSNVVVWGFAFSFGVLQEYYTTHEPFKSHPSGIPAIGTTATGLSYLTMPIYFWVFQRYPRWRRWSCFASLPLLVAALVGASFANAVPQLLVFQGVLYAIAGNALVTPTITYLDEWFVRRKGLAVGIMWAGDGAGGVIMPILMQVLLSRVGFRWTLRIIAGIIVLLTAPLLVFLQPRVPVSATATPRPLDISFIRTPLFWTLQAFNVLQASGYFLPSNYLPTYVESLGLSSTFGSLTLILINLSSIFGCITVGFLADRIDITTILLSISLLAATTVFLTWGLSISVAPIYIFCITYGLTAGGYSSTWGGMVKEIQRRHEGIDASMLFGFLAAGRGIGAVASGPLSELLLTAGERMHSRAEFGYGTEYSPIIIFSGCTALVGGGSWMLRRAGWI